MPLPVRTWSMTPMKLFSSVSTVSDRLVALNDFLTNYMTHWETSVLDPGGTKTYLEFKPAVGAPASIQNFRGLFLGTAADDGFPSSGMVSPTTTVQGGGQMLYTYAPDVGGTFGTDGVGTTDWQSGNPWANRITPAVNNRYGGYHRWAQGGQTWNYMYAIECEDMFWIVAGLGPETVTSQYQWPCVGGAIWETPSVALGDSVRGDEAMYGAKVWGYTHLGHYADGVLWYNTVEGDSSQPGLQGQNMDTGDNRQYRQGTVSALWPDSQLLSGGYRLQRMISSEHAYPPAGENVNLSSQTFQYEDGSFDADAIEYRWRDVAAKVKAAHLRQVFAGAHRLSAVEITNTSGVVVGFSLSRYLTGGSRDAFLLLNQAAPQS